MNKHVEHNESKKTIEQLLEAAGRSCRKYGLPAPATPSPEARARLNAVLDAKFGKK